MGDLALPKGFAYKVISREGDLMSDGNLTPGAFDGMGAFSESGATILIRNHEHRTTFNNDVPLVVTPDKSYDLAFLGGCTKVVVDESREVIESFAVLGGTSTNCAGGTTPWGSWITCEEAFTMGAQPHGYAFEVHAGATEPVLARPIKQAGRFVHEGVAFLDGVLYLTEDASESSFYRYVPETSPSKPGDLADSHGPLQALCIEGHPNADTKSGWPLRREFATRWVTIDEPDPGTNTVFSQAQEKGAAVFSREEGIWQVGERIYFDCTDGGAAGLGQIWEYVPRRSTINLVFESRDRNELSNPDNLCLVPLTGHLFLCEDTDHPQFVRGLSRDGRIYDFARAITTDSEFCGATFDRLGETLYVNQQRPGVTYAIWGPWSRIQ